MSVDPIKLNGFWVEDKKRSDPDGPALDIVKAGYLFRKGVAAIRGLDIGYTPGENFKFSLVTIVPFFKVTEIYPLNGDKQEYKRRDMRSGKHIGHCEQKGNEIHVHYEFPDTDVHGKGHDIYKLENEDEMHMICYAETNIGKNTCTKIYTRKR